MIGFLGDFLFAENLEEARLLMVLLSAGFRSFDFVKNKKDEGKIKAVEMSFHDMPELLEEILEEYGD